MPSAVVEWTAVCAGPCGRVMRPERARYLTHLPRHKGKGLCETCYGKQRTPQPPADFRICTCGRKLVARGQMVPEGFYVHQGLGLCSRCYTRERRELAATDSD